MPRVRDENIIWHYGDSLDDYVVVWTDAFGAPINLAGYTATMRIRTQPGQTGASALELNSSGQGLSITPAEGKIAFNATPTKMKSGSLAQNTSYYYDLQVANVAETKTLIKGRFIVDSEVTDV